MDCSSATTLDVGLREAAPLKSTTTDRFASCGGSTLRCVFGFFSSPPLTREQLLRQAEELRGRRKPKKAIKVLRKVLTETPKDPEVHAKLGPLLMQLGKRDEALESFRIAADDLDARGFSDKSLSLWLQIAQARRSDLDAWEKVSQFHVSKGRKAEGVKVLYDASALQLQDGAAGRERAIRLLRDVLLFDPKHLDGVLSLAPLLKKEGQLDEAKALLEDALGFAEGAQQRRVRRAQFFLTPGFRTLWRWFRA